MQILKAEEFRRHLCDELGVDHGSGLIDLDSLARFEMLMVIEDDFNVLLGDEVLGHAETWDLLYQEYVTARIQAEEA